MVRVRASAGWSHSKVTPTTSSPAPIANRISVVDGSRDTMRTSTHPTILRVDDPTLTVLALLALAGLAAGFVDAVVGGSGLIQIPALLLGLPGRAPVQVLATNKLASICGTTVSSATYYRRVRPDPRTFGPADGARVRRVGAGRAGRLARSRASAFDPIVLVVLVVVGAYVLLKPRLGEETALRFAGHQHTAAAMVTGLAIGFYDGALGPGHRQLLRVHPGRPARLQLPRGLGQGPAGQLGDQPRGAVRVRPAGRGAVEGRPGDGRCATSPAGTSAPAPRSPGAPRFVRVFFIVVVSAFIVRIGGEVLGFWG